MKAYVITLRGNTYSETCADRCIESAAKFGVTVEKFNAVPKEDALRVMALYALKWTWPMDKPDVCGHTWLKRHLYPTTDHTARIGCSMSHFTLWCECEVRGEPILILEHDAVFINPMPELPKEFGAIMLNNPTGATPKGRWWADKIKAKGAGVWPKTYVFDDGRPDGLAGNSAYIISPKAATACADMFYKYGVWPNDATLCRQLVPGLMEVYPFVTEARQTKSTSGGY
jgi:GR25 family glycosyltransferase involved in LPS biosynthesis